MIIKRYLEESFIIVDAILAIWPRFTNNFSPFDQLQSLNLLLDQVASHGDFMHPLHFLGRPRSMNLATKVVLPHNLSSSDIDQCFMEVGRVLEVKVGVDNSRWRNCGTSRMLRLEETCFVRQQLIRELT
jgi:hypothetical protein